MNSKHLPTAADEVELAVKNDRPLNRREFLARSGLIAGGVAAAGITGTAVAQSAAPAADAANLPPNIPAWTRSLGGPTAVPYGKPSDFESDVIRHMYPGLKEPMSAYSTSPLQDLDGIITPNGVFYERHHAGVPKIDPAQHRLMVHGMVERPLIFTMEELRQFPAESHIYFMECSGNPSFLPPWGKTAAEVAGLVSCAEWTGVPLKTLLNEVGVDPTATWIIAEGADGAGMNRSIPMEKCMDDVMVVYSQNGERLRPEQGRGTEYRRRTRVDPPAAPVVRLIDDASDSLHHAEDERLFSDSHGIVASWKARWRAGRRRPATRRGCAWSTSSASPFESTCSVCWPDGIGG